jgi:hypothetical protein
MCDVGCGSGRDSTWAALQGCEVCIQTAFPVVGGWGVGGGVDTGYGHEGTTQSPVAQLPGATWRPDRVRARLACF